MFDKVKKNFGFGCMRLPMDGKEVDKTQFCEMIDTFMQNGFNYFDTARGYIGGKSETALRDCLVARYPRESFVLVNKLTAPFFNTTEDIRPFFQSQLDACGVEYFDFYLMHAQEKTVYEKFKKWHAYETALELKKEGKIKHFGISFHDKSTLLDTILTEYPQVEVVQIQFNYADYEDESIESRKCYEVCRKHNKPVIVMEPVKGGSLVNLPQTAKEILAQAGDGSEASFAIRFAASFEGIFMVLSGMGNMQMMLDNISYMKDFQPLNEREFAAIEKVREIFRSQNLIACTGCRYCVDGCPKNISIPDLFSCMNGKKQFNSWNGDYYYGVHTRTGGKASECIGCAKCENICPQHLPVRALLKQVVEAFEK